MVLCAVVVLRDRQHGTSVQAPRPRLFRDLKQAKNGKTRRTPGRNSRGTAHNTGRTVVACMCVLLLAGGLGFRTRANQRSRSGWVGLGTGLSRPGVLSC